MRWRQGHRELKIGGLSDYTAQIEELEFLDLETRFEYIIYLEQQAKKCGIMPTNFFLAHGWNQTRIINFPYLREKLS